MDNPATLPILQGLRVIEATAFIAAPLGGLTLCQFGADVIRIDPPGGSLDIGRWPLADDKRTSLFWTGLNKGKRSVVIDTTQPEGNELAMALATAPGEGAGLVLTNLPPRGWLSYENLRARRSDLIQLTLTGDRHGGSQVDYTVNARLGVPYFTGDAIDDRPVNHVLPAWDISTGYLAALGIMGAERHRRLTGQGQHVKLALEDVGLATLGNLGFIAEAELGRPRQRINNDLFGAFGSDFTCGDGVRIMIVGLTERQWRSLCKACKMEVDMVSLGKQLNMDLNLEGSRFLARKAIAKVVNSWIVARSFDEVASTFDAHGVCWGRYQTIEELVTRDSACSVDNPLFSKIEQPGVGCTLAPGLPLTYSILGRSSARPAARFGKHTEEVLHELLGIDSAGFGRLVDKGVVQTAS